MSKCSRESVAGGNRYIRYMDTSFRSGIIEQKKWLSLIFPVGDDVDHVTVRVLEFNSTPTENALRV